MRFSIIIPVKELNSYIDESIPHLLSLDYPSDQYEILILPNSKPNQIPEHLKNQRIRIIPTGKVSPAVKRDIAAKEANGEILAFIDDDSYPKHNWLSIAEETFNNLPESFVAVNGPATTPHDATWREKMSGAFFESRLGGGAAHRCRDIGRSFIVEDAPSVNLLIKKKEFLDLGGFGSEYWPGEDSLFCQKIKDNGYKLWHQNDLIIYHHRRPTLTKHIKQVAGYGKHRGNFFRKNIGCSRKFIYTIPSLFLILNLVLVLFWIESWLILFYTYTIIMMLYYLIHTDLPIILSLPTAILTFVSHLTYGLFFIKGFLTKDIKSVLR